MLADRVRDLLRDLAQRRRPLPRSDVYEARLARTRTLYLVRSIPRPFDWSRDVPELRPAPRRTVERVEVDGQAFYVSRWVGDEVGL
jgi:hypothetical protein